MIVPDRAAGPGAIVHDYGLAQDFGETRRNRARGDIDVAAGRVGHDEAHGLFGIALRESGCDRKRGHYGRRYRFHRGFEGGRCKR